MYFFLRISSIIHQFSSRIAPSFVVILFYYSQDRSYYSSIWWPCLYCNKIRFVFWNIYIVKGGFRLAYFRFVSPRFFTFEVLLHSQLLSSMFFVTLTRVTNASENIASYHQLLTHLWLIDTYWPAVSSEHTGKTRIPRMQKQYLCKKKRAR